MFPYNIFGAAGASNFKFGAQLGFAQTHHNNTRRRKGARGPGLGDLPKIWGFSSMFTQWLKIATSNLVRSLGLPAHHHISLDEKWPRAKGAPQNLRLSL